MQASSVNRGDPLISAPNGGAAARMVFKSDASITDHAETHEARRYSPRPRYARGVA